MSTDRCRKQGVTPRNAPTMHGMADSMTRARPLALHWCTPLAYCPSRSGLPGFTGAPLPGPSPGPCASPPGCAGPGLGNIAMGHH